MFLVVKLISILESCHQKKIVCKSLLGVNPRAPNATVMGELRRLPLFISVVTLIIKYLNHVNEVKKKIPHYYVQELKKTMIYVPVNHGVREIIKGCC